MRKNLKRYLSVILCLCMLAVVFVGCKEEVSPDGGYTFRTYAWALAKNWNPHAWKTSADREVLNYVTMPLCAPVIKDSATGEYQWVFEMATSITDVTAANQEDLTTYAVNLPDGATAEDVNTGYVFEIKLNSKAKWQDGTAINADSYVYSMQMLLSSEMSNYRANLYRDGKMAVAGGRLYGISGAPIYEPMVLPYQTEGDFSYDLEKGIKEDKVYVNVDSEEMTLYPYSLNHFNTTYSLGLDEELQMLASQANNYGYTLVTKNNLDVVKKIVGAIAPLFAIEYSDDLLKEALWVFNGEYGETAEYDETVGCYRVDDYTLRYVTENAVTQDEFFAFCANNWLVHKDTYEKSIKDSGAKKTAAYGTGVDNTMSYGPYKLESIDDGKQMVLVQNENWYGWEKQLDGKLLSYTNFLVDGQKRQQYQTTRIVIDVMDGTQVKEAFFAGKLSQLGLTAADMQTYSGNPNLLTVETSKVNSFFFNTDTKALQAMDANKGNVNGVVLSSAEFRKALSLAIDRQMLTDLAVSGIPAYGLVNDRYTYDAHNDVNSSYRLSEAGKQAICELYGVTYGEEGQYSTLDEAYASVTGYDLDKAKALMKTACDKLVIAGLYTAGQEIKIRIAWSAGAVNTEAVAIVNQLNQFVNAATADSGFGTITFEAVGNVANRYTAVPAGDFAMGYGTWNGGVSAVTRIMQLYCDPATYALQEAACWDPANTELTLDVEGEQVTLTWQQWSRALEGNGPYAMASNEVKLSILGQMETKFLEQNFRIPLFSSTSATLMSKQVSYYTSTYNRVYGFGGLRLMTYHYDDAQWAAYVEDQDGTVSYQ